MQPVYGHKAEQGHGATVTSSHSKAKAWESQPAVPGHLAVMGDTEWKVLEKIDKYIHKHSTWGVSITTKTIWLNGTL